MDGSLIFFVISASPNSMHGACLANFTIPVLTLRFPFLQPVIACRGKLCFEIENDLWPMAALVNFQEPLAHALMSFQFHASSFRGGERGVHLSRVVSSLSKIEAHSAHMTSMPAAESSWRLYIPLPDVRI